MYSAPSELFSYSLMVENTDSTRQEKTSRNLGTEQRVVSQPGCPVAQRGTGQNRGHPPPRAPWQ